MLALLKYRCTPGKGESLGLDEELIPGFGKSVLVAPEHWLPQAFEESGSMVDT